MKKSIVYTCTGDAGSTSLVGGKRLPKDDVRIEVYGTVDELSAQIGVLASLDALDASDVEFLNVIQNKLFNIGSYLATDNGNAVTVEAAGLSDEDVERVEREIDRLDAELPQLRSFVLPGGCTAAACAHVCRTVARRAERRIVGLSHVAGVDPRVMRYVNRLSDYFFVFARFNNVRSHVDEILWDKNC